MPYPELINLPFNFSSIKDEFKLRHQAAEQPPDEPGYWAIIRGNSLVLKDQNGTVSLPESKLPSWLAPQQEPLSIGNWKGKPLRAFSVDKGLELHPGFTAETFNAVEIRMDIQTLTLGGLANQILHWIGQSRYCSRCGAVTGPIPGNWGRKCSGCNAEHYPHIHPCAIVLVKRGKQLLLTRKAEWVPGRYGLVAGFADFGESLEECAIREVKEETGITVRDVRYVGSQSWPFPAQLMAGFVAEYADGEIEVDHHELEDARWFDIDALPVLPPWRSIARYLLDRYAA